MVSLETLPGLDQVRRLDAADGESGYLILDHCGPLRLSESALRLLRAVRSGMSWDELAQHAGRPGRPATAADVEAAYSRIMESLATARERAQRSPLPAGFWFRRTLAGAGTVRRAAGLLAPLFATWPATALIAVIGLAVGDHLSAAPIPILDGAVFWPAYLLFVASLIGHEMGHATACHRFGAPPNDIGFTVYWLFPAFYSDVTAAWYLDRRQRVVVDLGGVFFQLGVGICYWIVYGVTDWQPFGAAFALILCGCLFSLNPFFKLDGYWLLSDALGVPRLSRQPARLWRHAIAHLRGRPGSPLPWPRRVTVVLAVYAPASLLFFLYFAARLLPEVWSRAMAYPTLLSEIVRDFLASSRVSTSALQGLLVSTFLLCVCGLVIRRLARRLITLAARGTAAPPSKHHLRRQS